MNTQFYLRGLNANAGLRRWLEQPLERLQCLTPVTAAAIVLEYQQDTTPAYRAFAQLAVPGPDVHAEGRDHTLEAAWRKVVTALRKQIEGRKNRQEARGKRIRHLRTPSVLRSRCRARWRA